MGKATDSDWIILRTASRFTLRLAETLAEDNFEAWTPVAGETTPMTPSYVFARSDQLIRLLNLAHSPSLQYRVWDSEVGRMVVRGHPYFSLMRGLDPATPWATVADAKLAPLRVIERRRKPRGIVKAVEIGSRVTVDERGFEGLVGIVESVVNKFATVVFPKCPWPIQVGCWLLKEKLDESHRFGVSDRESELAKAA